MANNKAAARGIQAIVPQLEADQVALDIRQQPPLAFLTVMDIQIGAFKAELNSIIKDICEHRIETEDDRPLAQLREIALKLKFPVGEKMTPVEMNEVLSERDQLVKGSKQAFPRRRWQEFRLRHSGKDKLQTRTETLSEDLKIDFEAILSKQEAKYDEEFAGIESDMSAYQRTSLSYVMPLGGAFNKFFPELTTHLRNINKLRVEYLLGRHLLTKRETDPFEGGDVSDIRIQEVLGLDDAELMALKKIQATWTDIRNVFSKMRDDINAEMKTLSKNNVELMTVVSGIIRGTIFPRNRRATNTAVAEYNKQKTYMELLLRDGLLQERDFFGERLKGEEGNTRIHLGRYLAAMKALKTAEDNVSAKLLARDERNRLLNQQEARITNTAENDQQSFGFYCKNKIKDENGIYRKTYGVPEQKINEDIEDREAEASDMEEKKDKLISFHNRTNPTKKYADDDAFAQDERLESGQNLNKDLNAGLMADPEDGLRPTRIPKNINDILMARLRGNLDSEGKRLLDTEHQKIISSFNQDFSGTVELNGTTYEIQKLGRDAAYLWLKEVYKQQFIDEVINPAKESILNRDSYRNIDKDIAISRREEVKAKKAQETAERRAMLFGYLLQHLSVLAQTTAGVYGLLRNTLDNANGLVAGEVKERLFGFEALRALQNVELGRMEEELNEVSAREVTKLDKPDVLIEILTNGEGVICSPAAAKRVAYLLKVEKVKYEQGKMAVNIAALDAINTEVLALGDEFPQEYKDEIGREVDAKKRVITTINASITTILGTNDIDVIQARLNEIYASIAEGRNYAGLLPVVVSVAKNRTSEIIKLEFLNRINLINTANPVDVQSLSGLTREVQNSCELTEKDREEVNKKIEEKKPKP